MEKQANNVLRYGLEHEKGVKGVSVISSLPLLDISTCFIPEYMHSVLLGVIKQIFEIWFTKSGNWNLQKYASEIDDILTQFKPPYF